MTEHYRNADTRIREAFAALRAEIEGVFPGAKGADPPALVIEITDKMRDHLLDYAKQPASEA
jgi:hypothetical protein